MKTLAETVELALREHGSTEHDEPRPTEEAIAAAAGEAVGKGWVPHDREAFSALCAYMAGARKTGLLLTGAPGVGKTFWLESVMGVRAVRSRVIISEFREAQDYTSKFWHRTFRAMDSEQSDGWAIDDLGEEPVCMIYGQKEEVMANVIAVRYEAWKRDGARTYVTTNLSALEIDRRYGRRILDRLREMCLPIEIKGHSNRARASRDAYKPSREVI